MAPSRQHLLFLELLVTTHFQQRLKLLDTLSLSQATFLSGVLHNILISNIVLDSEHRAKLLKHASLIRRLADKSTPLPIKCGLYRKHYKVFLSIFKPLLPELKARFCNGERNGAGPQGAVE